VLKGHHDLDLWPFDHLLVMTNLSAKLEDCMSKHSPMINEISCLRLVALTSLGSNLI